MWKLTTHIEKNTCVFKVTCSKS